MALRIPLSWLRDYVEIDQDPAELAEQLTIAGLEVESIQQLGENWGEYCVVASLLEVDKHPNADSLSLASVDFGADEPITVVTGAPNIRELENRMPANIPKVALALAGAQLVDAYRENHPIFRLKPSKIRGIRSEGMICSELELGLSEEHEGILFLPDDAPSGTLLKDYLGDSILEFDIKGSFAHLLSVRGIAREAGAVSRKPLLWGPLPDIKRLNVTENTDFVALKISDPDLCPRYSALLIRGVSIAPSPFWMQQRLLRAGMRPINNIVDITNYVMLELGQPLHAFDYRALKKRAGGGIPTIIMRRAEAGEVLTTLDGIERRLDREMLMITDTAGVIAIAGVMGGAETDVSEATTDILLESANFQFLNNRRTAQLLKLKSEASERFGKQIDPESTLQAALRAAELMEEHAGGVLDPVAGDLYPGRFERTYLTLDLGFVERLLGIHVPEQEIRRILEALGFGLSATNPMRVEVPSHRMDIRIPADLVEEIARVYGYNNMPSTLIQDALPPQHENRQLDGAERVRDLLTGAGLDEIITYSMTNPHDEARLRLQETVELKHYVPVKNPLSQERSHLRRMLLPGALNTARSNLRFVDQIRMFEIGSVFCPVEGELLPDEPMRLSLLVSGPRNQESWHDLGRGWIDFYDLKGIIEYLLSSLHIQPVEWNKSLDLPYHPGKSAAVYVGGERLGVFGELHPEVRREFGLPDQPFACGEFEFSALLKTGEDDFQMDEISAYTPVYEDLAVVVDASLPAEQIAPRILQAGNPLLRDVRLFDVYQGESIEPGKRSLAYALTYQAPDRTLTDRDVEKVRNRIVKRLKQEFKATLRS